MATKKSQTGNPVHFKRQMKAECELNAERGQAKELQNGSSVEEEEKREKGRC